jgi:hypothetical protein
MEVWIEAMGYLSQVVMILSQIKSAEKAGVGKIDLPPIYIHRHAATWTILGSAERTTEHANPKPAQP